MIKDSYYAHQERTCDVAERSRILSQSKRSQPFGLRPMDNPVIGPRGSISESSRGHRIQQPSVNTNSLLSDIPLAHRPRSIPDVGPTDFKESKPMPASIPRMQSGREANPPTLPSFQDSFGSLVKEADSSSRAKHDQDPIREEPLRTEDYDVGFSHLNQPRHGSYAQDLPKEHLTRQESISSSDPRSYALGSPLKRRKMSHEDVGPLKTRSHQNEGRYSSPSELVRLQSSQSLWDNQPESSGHRGSQHNSSGRSSPARMSQTPGQWQLPPLPTPIDTFSRGAGVSPLTPSGPRDHIWSGNHVHGSGRPGAQTYPQTSGSFATPSVADHYRYEQPRHGYSWSVSPHNASYQSAYPPQNYSQASTNSYSLSDGRSPFSTAQSHGYAEGYHPNGYHPSPMREPNNPRQRKRRGNLPKETTDKLRSWFMSNLNHPYPSEDQKQDMMRQTGLQMNQISNWFINARRRQLPLIQKNQEAMEERSKTASSGGLLTPNKSLSPRKNRLGAEETMDAGFEDDDDLDEEYPDTDENQPSMAPTMNSQPPYMYQGRRSDLAPLPEQPQGYKRSPEPSRVYTTYSPTQTSTLERDKEQTRGAIPDAFD